MAFDKDLPPWVKLVLQMQLIKVQIAAEAATQDKGLLTKAAETGKKLIGDLEKMLSKVPGLIPRGSGQSGSGLPRISEEPR